MWTEDLSELVTFAGVLVRADMLSTADDVLYFLYKPWKWEPEHEVWEGCGKPDLDDEGWDFFLRKMEREVLEHG